MQRSESDFMYKINLFSQVEKLEHDSQQQHAELMHLRDNRQSVIASTIREKDDEVKQIEFL